ncbi:carotenoid biosynthesis protein [Paenibacillus filicis]|uniref:Carotenoid biosynthesis protein n=1 Tax=Paenibacillus gyeongsangnamensis TaxID=3388067 RepID=A0ABT4QG44_9BACL|nr:carotenoid biosynthesis protein [Paenibacillus filicis]MCZ8515853.1 carotenoid biosynthesis protein [Paenibacillus filicis]
MVIRLLQGLTLLYAFAFICGLILVGAGLLSSWLEWATGFYLILGGLTALVWYVSRYGKRQTVFLFVITASVSYAAEWIGAHTELWFGGYEYGLAFAPLLFGVPLAVPFAWCMLLITGKALAPVRIPADSWRGLTLAETQAPNKRKLLRARRRIRRRSFWLPAVWGASMAAAVVLLLNPAAIKLRYGAWKAGLGQSGWPAFYDIPLSNFLCWWLIALLILKLVNYLHDEYFRMIRTSSSIVSLPVMLLITLEALFLTLALRSGLGWAAALNLLLLSGLLLWKRTEERA